MATITEVTRKFMFNQNELTDIPQLSPEQIKDHYSAFYPELVNAEISNLGLDDKSTMIYEFKLKIGTNG